MGVSVFANGLTYLLIQLIVCIDTNTTDCIFTPILFLLPFLTKVIKTKSGSILVMRSCTIDLIFYFLIFYVFIVAIAFHLRDYNYEILNKMALTRHI